MALGKQRVKVGMVFGKVNYQVGLEVYIFLSQTTL